MSLPLHLTRARLRRDADLRALAPILMPDREDARIAAGHQLAWALFAGDPEARRDFLWREEAPGQLILLSPRPPVAGDRLFEIETRPFAALPKTGDRLAFALRANPTVAVGQPGRAANGKFRRGKTVDVVMAALHATPSRRGADGRMARKLAPGRDRPFMRDTLLGWLDGTDEAQAGDPRRPALGWLAQQGARKGFDLDRGKTAVNAYRRVSLPRRGTSNAAVFGQVDYEGVLTVTDEVLFRQALGEGFGRAKAFGCGLMLIARERPG